MKYILIAIGGATGSILRYIVSAATSNNLVSTFPVTTLTVNLAGSMIIGLFYGIGIRQPFSNDLKLFLFTGLLGGFTTFSAFSLETFVLIKDGNIAMAAIYALSSVILCIAGVAIGVSISSVIR